MKVDPRELQLKRSQEEVQSFIDSCANVIPRPAPPPGPNRAQRRAMAKKKGKVEQR